MNQVLAQVGLLVRCRKCLKESRVVPDGKYGGWFKSKIFKTWRLKWYCPEHYEIGKEVDRKAFENKGEPVALVYTEVAEHEPDDLDKLMELI